MAKQETTSARLRSVGEEYWQFLLQRDPTWATYLGDYRYNDRLPDIGPEGRRWTREELGKIRERLLDIPREGLSRQEKVTWQILRIKLELEIEGFQHKFYQWSIDQLEGPQVWFPQLLDYHPLKTKKDYADLLARFQAFPVFMEQYMENLKEGGEEGRVAPRVTVKRVIEQLRSFLSTPVKDSPFAVSYKKLPERFSSETRRQLSRELQTAISGKIYPSYQKLLTYLEGEYLSKARDEVGVWSMKDGERAYEYAIKQHTGTGMTAEEIHQIGLQELKAIHEEMKEVARNLGHQGDLPSFFSKVKGNPSDFSQTREGMLREFKAILRGVDKKLPEYFSRLPKTWYVVKPVEWYREKDAPAAYYYPPPDNGSRPGIFYANTYMPKTRLTYTMAALAVHEAVPGHHLQVALALELRNLPSFRRHVDFTAYVEGWGLYSERLAQEMGVYRSDLERFGMLTYQAWRATRLVVDTGIHHLKWSREKAMTFFLENVPLTEEEVANEVDRYITWPGQALSYMIGEREILRLRKEAREQLGSRFSIREFHDIVLRDGAVPLSILDENVQEWVKRKKG